MVKIGVVGATGWQGCAVIDSLLAAEPDYPVEIVAFSRNPESSACQLLKDKVDNKHKAAATTGVTGIEFRRCDLLDSTAEELANAFRGVDRLFVVTQFWNTPKPAAKGGSGAMGNCACSPELELKQGQNMLAAAEKAGTVKHVVFSTMENTLDEKRYPGAEMVRKYDSKWRTPHLDAKGMISELLAFHPTLGVSLMNTSFYMENFFDLTRPIGYPGTGLLGKERLLLGFPLNKDSVLPMISVEDIGHAGCALLLHPEQPAKVGTKNCWHEYFKTNGVREVHVTGDNLSYETIAQKLGACIERTIDTYYIPAPIFALFPFEGAKDLGIMFEFKRIVASFVETRKVEAVVQLFSTVKGLPRKTITFDEFLSRNQKTLQADKSGAPTEHRGLYLGNLWATFLKLKIFGQRQ